MLLSAIKVEVDEQITEHAEHPAEAGHALVLRHGVAALAKGDDSCRRALSGLRDCHVISSAKWYT